MEVSFWDLLGGGGGRRGEAERDWEIEGEARGSEIVCACVCVDAGEEKG